MPQTNEANRSIGAGNAKFADIERRCHRRCGASLVSPLTHSPIVSAALWLTPSAEGRRSANSDAEIDVSRQRLPRAAARPSCPDDRGCGCYGNRMTLTSEGLTVVPPMFHLHDTVSKLALEASLEKPVWGKHGDSPAHWAL
ncbi:unnamed protein product [Merluccius merluccius]